MPERLLDALALAGIPVEEQDVTDTASDKG